MELVTSLRTFIRVSEIGSFTAVATELGATPSLVSRQLSSLEEHLGTRLLNRSTRAISITDDGRSLIPLARQVIDATESLQHAVGRRRNVPSGCVRLGVPGALASHVLGHLVDLLSKHEEMVVDLVVHDAAANLVECGLDLDIQIGDVGDSPMIMRRLGSASAVLVAAPAYLRDRALPMHPHDLLAHECIVHQAWQHDNVWHFPSAGAEGALVVQGRMRSNNAETVHRAALAGWGIALLPHVLVRDDLRNGHLVSVLEDFPPQALALSVVYPSRRNLPLRTRTVLEFLAGLRWEDRQRDCARQAPRQ